MNLTPLEYAVLNAHEVPIGIAGMVLLQNLITQGDEASQGAKDQTLPHDIRIEALKESRHVNQTITLLAVIQESNGISA
tara:strand:+ start:168 stop:404 length:237 start_codon:yes stop_codon:yes gene_type:complete